MNRQISQAASAPTEILGTFKNIEWNATLYFNNMEESINRDVQNCQRLYRLKGRFSINESEFLGSEML